ncbi:CHAT domain-containing protein [Solemya velum gill symbiont]|uniref:CHAT domain-containing protein n=1 Tax=Solemya velum gill symbiont TaxID=2340 RepID=UPI000997CE36|nr:CHAT domain-containing protein [Solemya velum gill symbiont]OOY50451.1 hypothetical protein BOV97_11250 [Solemya velum gill symbiont]OOY54647.1 hypothetical protein BOV99_10445 [Solemya velum gill symbiont]OOY55240.1 hypothetical protein BOW00_10450 [Solemya velum gill symbiont]OOY59240.1 hypothetical protein BOW02_10655 [Solemya velum gill symbiont]OOY60798.1 hypothetical protein BOW04_10365 [Solemya velum gill symbiont]
MKIRELLPHTHNHLSGSIKLNWEKDFEFSIPHDVTELIDTVFSFQNVNVMSGNIDYVIECTKIILLDIVDSKRKIGDVEGVFVLNYIQFNITILPLDYYVNVGWHQESYNWVAYSLCDDLSDAQVKEFEVIRLVSFIKHPVLVDILNPCVISRWISGFYYMARSLSAIPDVGKEILQWSLDISIRALHLNCVDNFSDAYSQMACWSANYDDPRIWEIVKVMEDIAVNELAPEQLRCNFLVAMSTVVGRYTSRNSWEWAQEALETYPHLLKGHQTLQLSLDGINWADPESININVDIAIREIEKINKLNVEHAKGNQLLLYKLTDRLVSLIGPFIGTCIRNGRAELAITILHSWYLTEPNNPLKSEELLVFYPNYAFSLIYSIEGKSLVIERNQGNELQTMMATANDFLGISCSVGMVSDFVLNVPEEGRFGVPSDTASDEFERQLVEFYDLRNLKACCEKQSLKNIRGYISIPSHQQPIQYLLNKYLSVTWPYAVSLEKPFADRKVGRICMWCGAGSITEDIEVNAVSSIFTKHGIGVDYFPSDSTTVEQFKEIYQGDKYDLIWLMSHGEFDHWKPGAASIEIEQGVSISLDEILRLDVPNHDNRRLLLFNVCDGATYSNLGGLPRLGFAPALSNPSQCVISHLWPVNPWSAALFGALYAVNLSKTSSFFEGYVCTLNDFLLDRGQILQIVEEQVDDGQVLLERLTNQNIDYSLLAHAGSSAFFQ